MTESGGQRSRSTILVIAATGVVLIAGLFVAGILIGGSSTGHSASPTTATTAPVTTAPVTTETCKAIAGQCLSIDSSPRDTVVVGSPFTFTVTTTGPPVPKIKERGKLPKGVKFYKGTGTASISGTPVSSKHKTAVGTYSLTFTATFGKGKAKDVVTQLFTLTVLS